MARQKQGGLGYSYLRFSHPDQGKGDTLRRQTKLREDWLARNGVKLDTSLTLEDKGVSAYNGDHRDNPDRHALATFLHLVKQGRIPRGSYLIVESLDRLSREDIIPALSLVLNLIQAEIRIVQLLPAEVIYDSRSNPMHLMMAIMELSRGHSESVMKSERVGGAWREKKRRAAAERLPVTKRCPAWLRLRNGQWEVLEFAAEIIRNKIYRWAIDGYGEGSITKRLNAEKVPTIGKKNWWSKSSVAKLLSNPAVIGVYQPFKGRGKNRRPDGDAIPDYFPAIISQEEWDAARGALENRKQKGGRVSAQHINVFANLLRDARDQGSMHQKNSGEGNGGRTLVSYRAAQGVIGSRYVSFPFVVFERAILSCLREIDPREILPHNSEADKTLVLSGKLAQLEARIAKLRSKLRTDPDIDALVEVIRELETERKTVVQDLAHARQEAAAPLAEGWANCRSLLEALDKAPDQTEARIKLRSAIRRIVNRVWCLFVARGAQRLAAIQVWFTGGAHRDYLVLYRAGTGGAVGTRPARWSVRSLASAAVPGKLDLRKSEHAKRLEATLTALDLTALGDDEAGPTGGAGRRSG
jgi:DNA invertase Pin-like site-specific DNA recombinase